MSKTYKILLIENDKFLIKLYSDKLVREGFEVIVAASGEEGLSKTKSEKPSLVLLDIMLPRKNGFEILSEMKLDPKIKNIPVIIVTNLGQESDIKTGLDLGADDYLVKTDFSINDLPAKIRRVLAGSKK